MASANDGGPANTSTRGPWEWRKVGDSWLLWGFHGMRPIVLDVGQVRGTSRGRRILRMRNDGVMREASPHHPDARLIAAAPDLLAACKALVERWDNGNGISEEVKAIKSAIALARKGGEES